MIKKKILIYCICLILIYLTGCVKYEVIQNENQNCPPLYPFPIGYDSVITLYYPNKDMTKLVPEKREINDLNKKVEEIVIEQLFEGPIDEKLVRIIPEKTKLISIETIQGIVFVNLTENIINKKADEKEEAFVLYSIVNSLCQIKNVRKVQILIEGEVKEAFYNYYTIREPLNESELIVNKEYISPIRTIVKYYNSLKDKDYIKAVGLIYSRYDVGRINAIRSEIKYLNGVIQEYKIKEYLIDKYSNNLRIKVKLNLLRNLKEQDMTSTFKLIYDNGYFWIYDILK